ncbi:MULTISPECIES: hypothetical protein [Clostridium]|uniref:hypothetical protein n=1 Tax=Clostridium TaxID=1485 RepID=UPI0008257B6F|nr:MULTISPECIES: hypothetical protein [Clostridium]PJI07011.1 hypothetical protein CUB90_03640 [Clostridium sp. CT7]
MSIVQFMERFFQNIVIYAVFMCIISWIFGIIMMVVLVWQVILCIFRVKCNDDNFRKAINEEMDKKSKENE